MNLQRAVVTLVVIADAIGLLHIYQVDRVLCVVLLSLLGIQERSGGRSPSFGDSARKKDRLYARFCGGKY